MKEINSQERFEQRAPDTYFDRPFVRTLVKKIQDLDPDIGAVYYKDIKSILFFYKRIIIYKVMLTEYNIEEKKMEQHVTDCQKVLRMVKLNLVPIRELQSSMSKLNKKIGKTL